MAIFSRRTVDRMLTENATFSTEDQLDQVIARLNSTGFQALDAEWELAVLNAFDKVGNVAHEPALDGTANLDLLFTAADGSTFLSDITTVSDEGFEEKSPVKAFCLELQERLWRARLPYDGWTLSIGTHPAEYGQPKIPAIPPRNEFATEVFNDNFKRFVRNISDNPGEKQIYRVSTSKTAISLTYDPKGQFFTTLGPAYGAPQRKDQNPVFYALKSKAKQLKRVSYDGPKGIILCDGGTDMIHTGSHSSFDFNYNAVDATKEFLRQNQSIDFVLLVTSVWTEDGLHRPWVDGPRRKVKVTLIPNKSFVQLPEQVKQSLSGVEAYFPEPENTPSGARETIRHGFNQKELRPLAGGWAMSDNEIKISESAVLGLLSGAVTQDELFKALGFRPQAQNPSAIRNPFESMLSRKMRLREIQIEETTRDDNYVIFRFEGRDPALAAFTNPKKRQ
jgi:hypothetical protein